MRGLAARAYAAAAEAAACSAGIALGNLALEVSRKSGFYPDIVMAGSEPLRQLRSHKLIEPQARFFSKNRGLALLVRKGNPLGITGLADVTRMRARVALPDAVEEAASRARYRAAVSELIGEAAADAFFAAEAAHFAGRLGIVHRDFPEMVARGYADVGLTQYHLVSYWTRIFPDHFELVPISGAERFSQKIAFGRVIDPLRPRALGAFDEFFSAERETFIPNMISRGWMTASLARCCRSTERGGRLTAPRACRHGWRG